MPVLRGKLRVGSKVHNPLPLLRTLAFCMALVLLTVRVGSYTEEVFVTPLEDAIFSVAFVMADEEGKQARSPAVKAKRALDCVLLPSEVAPPPSVPVVATVPGYVPPFYDDEIADEIFVPPEASS